MMGRLARLRQAVVAAELGTPAAGDGTGNVNAGSVSSLASNALTWAIGDLLIAVASGNRSADDPARTYTPPSGFSSELDDYATITTQRGHIAASSLVAASGGEDGTVTNGFSGEMFSIASGLLKYPGGATILRKSPVAKKEAAGTTLTATFAGDDPAEDNDVLVFAMDRGGTDFSFPGTFTTLLNISTTQRLKVAYRRGHDSASVGLTGLTSGSAAVMQAWEMQA